MTSYLLLCNYWRVYLACCCLLLYFYTPIIAEDDWEPVVNPHNTIFPALVLSTLKTDEARPDNPVVALGSQMASCQHIGDYHCFIGIRMNHFNPGERVSVSINGDGVINKSDQEFELPLSGDSVELYPTIQWDLKGLRRSLSPMQTQIQFAIHRSNGETNKRMLLTDVESINECPSWINGESTHWAFAAFVNEDHPLVQQILKEALASGITPAFTGDHNLDTIPINSQIEAIWYALQKRGIRYSSIASELNGPNTENIAFQHVRYLEDCLKYQQANCVDGSALFASILTKIDIPCSLIAIPGHMFLGVVASNDQPAQNVQFIDSTILSAIYPQVNPLNINSQDSVRSCEAAFADANDEAMKADCAQAHFIPIRVLRQIGIRSVFADRAGPTHEEIQARDQANARFDAGIAAYRTDDPLKRQDFDQALIELTALRPDAELAQRDEELNALITQAKSQMLQVEKVQLERELADAIATVKRLLPLGNEVDITAALAHLRMVAERLDRLPEYEALDALWRQQKLEQRRKIIGKQFDDALSSGRGFLENGDLVSASVQLVVAHGLAREMGREHDVDLLEKILDDRRQAENRKKGILEIDQALEGHKSHNYELRGQFTQAKDDLESIRARAASVGDDQEKRIIALIDDLPRQERERTEIVASDKKEIENIMANSAYDLFGRAKVLCILLHSMNVDDPAVNLWAARLTGPTPWFSKSGKDEYGMWGELDGGSTVKIRFRLVPIPAARTGQPASSLWFTETEMTAGDVTELSVQYKNASIGDRPDVGIPALGITPLIVSEVSASLRAKTGRILRMPTYKEWTTACSGGTKSLLFFKDPQKTDEYVWHVDDSDGKPHPVATKQPNPYGLYDMLGNAAELVYRDNQFFVVGGSYKSLSFDLDREDPASAENQPYTGLRLVMDP